VNGGPLEAKQVIHCLMSQFVHNSS
jgi:hypothetical protein